MSELHQEGEIAMMRAIAPLATGLATLMLADDGTAQEQGLSRRADAFIGAMITTLCGTHSLLNNDALFAEAERTRARFEEGRRTDGSEMGVCERSAYASCLLGMRDIAERRYSESECLPEEPSAERTERAHGLDASRGLVAMMEEASRRIKEASPRRQIEEASRQIACKDPFWERYPAALIFDEDVEPFTRADEWRREVAATPRHCRSREDEVCEVQVVNIEDDEPVIGELPRQRESDEALIRRRAPTFTPPKDRSGLDHGMFVIKVISKLRDEIRDRPLRLVNVLSIIAQPALLINEVGDKLAEGDRRVHEIAAVIGYADTLGRMAVEAREPERWDKPPQPPEPEITAEMQSRFMGSEQSMQGYRQGRQEAIRALNEMRNTRVPGTEPGTDYLRHLAREAGVGASADDVREYVMAEVLEFSLDNAVAAAVCPPQ